MRKFLNEFKQFAARGNMIDLAVGVIIGGAFQKIITSLVNDVIMPFISVFTGDIDFTDRFFTLDGNKYATIAEATSAGVVPIKYGSFLTAFLDFIIMAFVIFCMIKGINKLSAIGQKIVPIKLLEEEEKEEPKTKKCPYCESEIPFHATRCSHCTSVLEGYSNPNEEKEPAQEE